MVTLGGEVSQACVREPLDARDESDVPGRVLGLCHE